MGAAAEWDADEEKARERRIAERRTRVQEKLRVQQQQRVKQDCTTEQYDHFTSAASATKGKQQAAVSGEAVRALLAQHEAAAEAVLTGAEGRNEVHRAECEAEEAALREQVAAEAEATRRENRAIDLEWEQLQSITNPQQLAAGIQSVSAHCTRVLESKEGVLCALRVLLTRRDEQFVRLLREQAEETDALIASMHEQHVYLKGAQERELEAVEAAYLQERSELLASHKAELDRLLEQRSVAEAQFMEQYLAACEQYENELERLRVDGLGEHGTLKRKLECEVASLEAHLDGIKAAYMLNADKLDYNYRVLVERERESKEALMQQKRKITRQWEVLNRLRKRHAAAEGRAAGDNARLSDEYQNVTRAFNHLQTKFMHFKAADLARFEQVRAMKDEELGELLEQLLEADSFISSFVVGLPPPSHSRPPSGRVPTGSHGGSAGGAGQLELVGQAVVVDPRARAAAAAAFGPGEEAPGEVLALSAEEAAQRGQLIAAYHPGTAEDSGEGEATGSSSGSKVESEAEAGYGAGEGAGGAWPAVVVVDAVAEQELRASADSGALSLLLAPNRLQLQQQQVRQLLAQVVETAGARGGVSADAVARSLGFQHTNTVAAMERAFAAAAGAAVAGAGSSGADASLADTIKPRNAAEMNPTADGAEGAGGGHSEHSGQGTYSVEHAEQGLSLLLQQLLGSSGSMQGGVASAAQASRPAGSAATMAPPTSKQYWQAKVDAVLPGTVARAWGLLETQASKRFAALQGRTGAADEVLALRQENDWLKATLAELLNSPLNQELQLPPTLLLR